MTKTYMRPSLSPRGISLTQDIRLEVSEGATTRSGVKQRILLVLAAAAIQSTSNSSDSRSVCSIVSVCRFFAKCRVESCADQ